MCSAESLSAERLCQLLPELELPCFIYDPAIAAATIIQIRKVFPAYHYPVKCNPQPGLLQAVIAAGAELDLCSEGDLEIARGLGALTARTSYTGAGLTPEVLGLVAASGCRVNLDSLHEVALWSQVAPARACGVRLRLPPSESAYSSKFGMTAAEAGRARDILAGGGGRLAGVHVHDGHRGRSPEEAAGVLTAALRPLADPLVRNLDYLSLGGGWSHAYEGEQPWAIDDVGRAFTTGPLAELRGKGFRGELLVEPGEFAVSAAGAWLARVSTVKPGEHSGERLVILDTPTPIPFADIPYPLRLLRKKDSDDTYEPAALTTAVPCVVHGSTNSGRDCIRRSVLLPNPMPGDVVLIGDAGAYVQSLISRFNERRPPAEYLLPPPGTTPAG